MCEIREGLGNTGEYEGGFRYRFNIDGEDFYVHEVDSRTISELLRSGAGDLTERNLHITSPIKISDKAVEIVNKYGADVLRYYLLAKFQPFTDGDFSEEKLIDTYNGDLANGLGNLISRVAKLCEKAKIGSDKEQVRLDQEVVNSLEIYRFDEALKVIFEKYVTALDQEIRWQARWFRGS